MDSFVSVFYPSKMEVYLNETREPNLMPFHEILVVS